ncbi:hypothetical protein V6Z11_A09G049600 [Gossypium hirsutum]
MMCILYLRVDLRARDFPVGTVVMRNHRTRFKVLVVLGRLWHKIEPGVYPETQKLSF